VVVPRLEVAAAWGAAAEPQQEVAARDAAAEPRQEVAARDAAAEPRQEVAAWDAAAVPRQEVAARVGAAVPRQVAAEQAGAAGALLQEAAPDVRVEQRRAALPSAVPLVFRRGPTPPWPAPQPAAQLARAMGRSRIATP
jgi:hypothetical protein